jgi:pimeloyl-ACP methyl ester carboxylesterase
MSKAEAEAKINDINIHYRVYGEGEPLLLIMGLGGNADWWHDHFVQRLAERFQVVTFDNRGTGRTDKPEGPYSIAQMASDAVGLMDHLVWSSANVMGVSMGGMIAQELTLNYPERVKRLVLACTNCGGQEQVLAAPEALSLLTLPRGELSEEELLRATLPLLFQPEYIEKNQELIDEVIKRLIIAPTPPKSFMNQFQGISTWSAHSRLGGIKQPTLVITGDEDILIPPENSRILAEAIPDCRLEEIRGGAHGFISQFPDKVADEVLAFLS